MNLKYHGVLTHLKHAVEVLATSHGNQQKRLYDAYVGYLTAIHPDNLPADQREVFIQFRKDMTRIPDTSISQASGALLTTTSQMHWKTAERLCKTLFDLYQAVNTAYYNKEAA